MSVKTVSVALSGDTEIGRFLGPAYGSSPKRPAFVLSCFRGAFAGSTSAGAALRICPCAELLSSCAWRRYASSAGHAQSPTPEDLVKQGRALVSQGKLDEAVSVYRQAIKLGPQSFDARLAMGIVLDSAGSVRGSAHASHRRHSAARRPAPATRR